MKARIANTQKNLDKENIRDDQAVWEYLKHQIRNFQSKLLSCCQKTQKLKLVKKSKS